MGVGPWICFLFVFFGGGVFLFALVTRSSKDKSDLETFAALN